MVSYFEWVQGLTYFFWEIMEVYERLEKAMVRAFREVTETAKKEKVGLRTAALMLAVGRVAEVMKVRGVYP